MPIKDILVGLSPRKEHDIATAYVVSMAAALGSKLTGMAYALAPPASFSLYPELTSELIQRYLDEAKKAAEEAGTRFVKAAKDARVAHEFWVGTSTLEQATADFARRLRTSDLAVLGRHEPGLDHVGDLFAEAALFHSGRPVMILPKDCDGRFSAHRVLIAWDDSRHAARAVAAVMPLLEKQSEVEVFTVKEDQKGSDLHGSELVQYLRLHGIDTELAQRNEPDVGAAIIREAEAMRAGIVVMGAYRHSRLREFVFGGATRRMLRDTPVPVLMTH